MAKKITKDTKLNKILLLQQNAPGDVIISTGVVHAFREQFPDSKIAYLVDPSMADLMDLDFVDELIPYTKGMPLWPVIKKLWHYDAAFCLDFKYRSAVVPFFARIPIRAGLAHKRKLLMTHYVQPHSDSQNMYYTEHIADVIERSTGLKLTGDLSHIYVADAKPSDIEAVDRLLPRKKFIGETGQKTIRVGIAPFTSTVVKDWPVERYKDLLERLETEGKEAGISYEFILIGGPREKKMDFPMTDSMTDLRGKLSFTESAEAMRWMDYIISGCSAPLHMAGAVGTPVLALYGPTSAKEWAPRHKCIVVGHFLDCNPCDKGGYGSPCNFQSPCMKMLTVEEVLEGFKRLMKEYPAK